MPSITNVKYGLGVAVSETAGEVINCDLPEDKDGDDGTRDHMATTPSCARSVRWSRASFF